MIPVFVLIIVVVLLVLVTAALAKLAEQQAQLTMLQQTAIQDRLDWEHELRDLERRAGAGRADAA